MRHGSRAGCYATCVDVRVRGGRAAAAASSWSWEERHIPSVDDREIGDGREGNGRIGGVGVGKDDGGGGDGEGSGDDVRSGGKCEGDGDGARGEGGRD